MQIGSVPLLPPQSSSQGWSERRERRSGYRRRNEDTTLNIEDAGHTTNCPTGPSLSFLTQVAGQTLSAPVTPTGGYQAPRSRCGVCADERA
jgi:hypothetical protein